MSAAQNMAHCSPVSRRFAKLALNIWSIYGRVHVIHSILVHGVTSREQGRRHAPDNAWLVRKTIPCLIVLGGNKPSEVARARRHHPRGRRLRSAARSIPPLHKAPEQSAHNATGGVMPSREDRNNRISALKFSGTMPPQLPVLFALIQILLGCDRRRRIRAPFGAL
jgi:hypothetical protein